MDKGYLFLNVSNIRLRRDYVHSLRDYVKMVSESMNVYLNDEKIHKIAKKLVKSQKYNDMLLELERMILIEKRKL